MSAKKKLALNADTSGDCASLDKIRAHIAMLETLQPDADRAIEQLRREIVALSAEARHSLKTNEERIANHGEKPTKALRKQLDRIEEKQKRLFDASPDEPARFLRCYSRYLRSILKLRNDL